MRLRRQARRYITTGLMILFLVLALVPIYQILAQVSPKGQFVQLCSSMGIQTVWVADDAANTTNTNPSLSQNSAVERSDGALSTSSGLTNLSSPFGSCEFCWISVLATVLPLVFILFIGLPRACFSPPVHQTQAFHSFLRQWHASPRAPPAFSLI